MIEIIKKGVGIEHSKSSSTFSKVSGFLQGILSDLNNAYIWMVSILLLHPNCCNSLLNSLGIAPNPLITTGITVTQRFHSFLARSLYLLIFLLVFIWTLKRQNPLDNEFYLSLISIRSGLLAGIKWSVFISKSQMSFPPRFMVCVSTT